MKPRRKKKLRVAILFGGRSAEHEVSIVSARSVFESLDRRKYEPLLIGITKNGRWLTGSSAGLLIGNLPNKRSTALILPDPTERGLLSVRSKAPARPGPIDVVFPVLHGPYGEDGTVQGLLELAGIPYVGSGVLGSAVGMDKVIQKHVLASHGFPIVPFLGFRSAEWNDHPKRVRRSILASLRFPLFVKPANLGSSVGITKVRRPDELVSAIDEALRYDEKIILEAAVQRAREFECAVLGNNRPRASGVGEIKPSNEFYDYDAKYVDGKSNCVIPAPIRFTLKRRIQKLALAAFQALDASGLARVDFLYGRGRLFVNEINTLPGFTSISMYPKLWEAEGMTYPKLIDELIRLAIERRRSRAALKLDYRPRHRWYRNA